MVSELQRAAAARCDALVAMGVVVAGVVAIAPDGGLRDFLVVNPVKGVGVGTIADGSAYHDNREWSYHAGYKSFSPSSRSSPTR